MQLSFYPHTLEFKRPFGISSGTRNSTPVVFTTIEYQGFIGYGEASMPPYLGENHESVVLFLSKAKEVIASYKEPFEIETILNTIDSIASNNTAAKSAIDIALHDLVGKVLQQPWHSLWKLDKNKTPLTTYTIGIDSLESIKDKIIESADYKILKVKLGSDKDKQIIETIRTYTDKPLAVDINQGWQDKHFALDMIHWLKEKNTLFIEQPMPKEKVNEMAWLTEKSPLPTIADESFQRIGDLEKVKGVFNGINIKLMKCTGMREAYNIISLAKQQGLKILIGCMSETSCAVSAAAQLSPLADWADLDGPLLIKKDYFNGITFNEGKIILNDLPGIGVIQTEIF